MMNDLAVPQQSHPLPEEPIYEDFENELPVNSSDQVKLLEKLIEDGVVFNKISKSQEQLLRDAWMGFFNSQAALTFLNDKDIKILENRIDRIRLRCMNYSKRSEYNVGYGAVLQSISDFAKMRIRRSYMGKERLAQQTQIRAMGGIQDVTPTSRPKQSQKLWQKIFKL